MCASKLKYENAAVLIIAQSGNNQLPIVDRQSVVGRYRKILFGNKTERGQFPL